MYTGGGKRDKTQYNTFLDCTKWFVLRVKSTNGEGETNALTKINKRGLRNLAALFPMNMSRTVLQK